MWVPDDIPGDDAYRWRVKRIAKAIPDVCMEEESPHHSPALRRLYRLLISHTWPEKELEMIRADIFIQIGEAVKEGNEMVIEHLKLVGIQP